MTTPVWHITTETINLTRTKKEILVLTVVWQILFLLSAVLANMIIQFNVYVANPTTSGRFINISQYERLCHIYKLSEKSTVTVEKNAKKSNEEKKPAVTKTGITAEKKHYFWSTL